MRRSAQRTTQDDYICVDYYQGKWRVSIGERIYIKSSERTKVFQFAGRLAEREGLGVAFYSKIASSTVLS